MCMIVKRKFVRTKISVILQKKRFHINLPLAYKLACNEARLGDKRLDVEKCLNGIVMFRKISINELGIDTNDFALLIRPI